MCSQTQPRCPSRNAASGELLVRRLTLTAAVLFATASARAGDLITVNTDNNELYAVDQVTGTVLSIGSLGVGFSVNDFDLATHGGIVYGLADLGLEVLLMEIDPATGAASNIVTVTDGGLPPGRAEGLASDGNSLFLSYATANANDLGSDVIGNVSTVDGSISGTVDFAGFTYNNLHGPDFDGLTWDPIGTRFLATDSYHGNMAGDPITVALLEMTLQPKTEQLVGNFGTDGTLFQENDTRTNDIAFAGGSLWGINHFAPHYFFEIDDSDGSEISRIVLDREGFYTGLTESPITVPKLNGIIGDVNQDGSLSTGTGDPLDDDVAAFLQGWRTTGYNGDLERYLHGDLNFDDITNLADAFILHEALESQGLAFPFEALTAVPEPASCCLLALSGAFLLVFRQPRR